MNAKTDLEQVLRAHFDNQADPTARDGQLDRVIDRIATVRQRPGWTIPERWLPMSAISARFAAAPRLPLRVLVLALLVLALAVSALLLAGALRHSVPPPFGPASNGLIAFADVGGSIQVGDPVTGAARLLVAGPGNERPVFSPDGTRVAFLSSAAHGGKDVIVVRADGSGALQLTAAPLPSVGFLAWSPDSGSVVVGNTFGELDVYDSTHVGSPTSLGASAGSDNFNANTAELYQPPEGQKVLVLRAGSPHPSLLLSDRGGANEQALIDGTRADAAFIFFGSPQWSPDGSMITFIGAKRDVAEDYLAYVMNADGSGVRLLSKATHPIDESNPVWSPDGTRIALQRWDILSADEQIPQPITVIDVQTGVELKVGPPPVTNGFDAWDWSPDGQSILELPVPDRLIVINVSTGLARTMTWGEVSGPSWQRLAP